MVAPKRILVIEDNEQVSELLVAVLANAYTVNVAAEGHAGVVAALSFLPDVILCDLFMPGMTGWEVIERLKSHAATASIPVILMSGRGEMSPTNFEPADFLQKPFRPGEVHAALERVLAITKRFAPPGDAGNSTTAPPLD